MQKFRDYAVVLIMAPLLALAGCAADKPAISSDLTIALDVATTVEGAYAAKPDADPVKVAEVTRLLATAQAAVATWSASSSPEDQALASAAISALVEYEATAAK